MGKSGCYLCDLGHFSPRPDLRQNGGNVGKCGKRLAPGMQKDQVVVETFGQGALSANPEGALLQACEPSCGLRFGEVTIPPFVILHARLGDERFSVGQSAYDIGQILMRFILERVANREWSVL